MFKRMLIGAVAGAAATVPQSAVMWGARRLGYFQGKAPPEQVSEGTLGRLVDLDELSDEQQEALKLAQHFAFGASCGAAFGLLTGVVRPTVAAGVIVALAIWRLSYDGWIPALGIMPPPERDEQGRQGALIAAHVAYGLALGLLVDKMTSKNEE
jgi:hypothetical protein